MSHAPAPNESLLDEDDARAAMRLLRSRMGWGRIVRMADDLWKEENAADGRPDDRRDGTTATSEADAVRPVEDGPMQDRKIPVADRDAPSFPKSQTPRSGRNLARIRRARERRFRGVPSEAS